MTESKRGRPSRSMETVSPHAELDRLLVEGELVLDAAGKQTRVYPKACEIAERLGVSRSWISKFAKQQRCFQRRAELQDKVRAKVTEQLIEKEAERIAFDTQRQLEFCDEILVQYRQAVRDRGVGNVTSTDVNNLIRLRRLLQGEADSRQELNHGVTLEMMQEAHEQVMRSYGSTSAAERGYSEESGSAPATSRPPTQLFGSGQSGSEYSPEVDQKGGAANVR